ncbi:uncharacterized protein [Maniola hyperantus]|uniref:uncharacterized protein n=1 Tax=Aphantopus hyperantus TaxID=2795564 RepID=UPI003747EA20
MKGLHALCGTIGLQVCLLAGILVMNSSSGAAAPVRVSDRKVEHICVQFCALLFGVASAGSAYFAGFKSLITLHSIFGIVATGLAILTGLSGLFLFELCRPSSKENENFGVCLYVHLITGIFACIASSMCFVSGITSDIFVRWLPVHEMYGYMVICCAVYTTIIVYKPMIMIFTGRRDRLTEY